MNLSKDLVPIIRKVDMDSEATKFLKKYYPKALEEPMPVPVEDIAELKMGLEIDYVNIDADLKTLGMMVFSDGPVELYDKETGQYIRRNYSKGTLLVERDLCGTGNRGRERFTITHEMVHWEKHKLRFMMLSLKDKNLAKACRCPQEKSYTPKTPEEWMEWQADNLAAAILMPAEMFKQKAAEVKYKYRAENVRRIFGGEGIIREAKIGELAGAFKVSRQAAEIRINTLGVSF